MLSTNCMSCGEVMPNCVLLHIPCLENDAESGHYEVIWLEGSHVMNTHHSFQICVECMLSAIKNLHVGAYKDQSNRG